MGKKRKQDQRRDESSSSDAKRHRSCHCQNGDSSDGMPREGSFRDAVIELKDFIQVKVSTEEKFKRKIENFKQKRKKDKKKQEEFKEYIRILTEDVRSLKESHEELKSKFQETQKEGCAEVNQYDASPSQRSHLSQSTKFRLVIENEVRKTIYKRERVETIDGGGRIKVVMYDGVNRIASGHPLASVKVDLVVIEGWFSECKPTQDSWSKEEFEKSIVQPRKGITRVVKNGTFDLVNGSCAHEGAIIMDNSQQREVKLGVMIAVPTELRVLEGVSNPFKVQEGRTKNSGSKKKVQKPPPLVPTGNMVQQTGIHKTQHGQGLVSQGEQHSLPPPDIQGLLQKEDRGGHKQFPTDDTVEDNRLRSYPLVTMPLTAAPVQGNGHALFGNGQKSSQQIPMLFSGHSTSAHSMQHGQDHSLPAPNIQRPLQAAADQFSLDCGQDWYTYFRDASPELESNFSAYTFSGLQTGQWTSTPEGEISVEDAQHLNAQKQIQETSGSLTCGQVLLLWDKPDVELKQRFDFLNQIMSPFSTHRESFPSTSLIYKAHKLLASATRTPPHRRGVLIRSIEPYYSDDEPTVKKKRHPTYQLRFVNRACNEYYTWEQIKSDDGNFLKVALYDENNLVVTSGPLSSASVEIILLHGDFNAEGQDNWTSEEFNTFLVCPHSVKEPPALGGDRVLVLIDGEADLGNMNFQNSSFHARTGKFKLGVELRNVREERVQEGITSSFLVRARQGEGGFSKKSNVGCGGYGEVYKEKKNTMQNKLQDTCVMPMKLPYKLLKEITDNFSNDHIVGSGTYGDVYKGVLKTGDPIAVKKLYQYLELDNEEFENQFTRLMRLKHKNIVRLIGYAVDVERALCSEYLPRGNLHKHIKDEFSRFDWSARYDIIKGICEGLNYLHSNHIYHLDLKPSNILLDEHMVPKISDFGLSRLFIDSAHPTGNLLARTTGYLPPEFVDLQKFSFKSDIYSLGIVILEILAGQFQMPRGFTPDSTRIEQENWRKTLRARMRPHASEKVQKCIEIALKCADLDRMKRPTTTEIVDELNKIDTANSSSGSSYSKMKTQGNSDSEEEQSEEELVCKEEPNLRS